MPKEKLDFVLSIMAVSLFILTLVIAVIMLFRIYLKRKNKLLLEQERMNAQFAKTLLESKLEIQEQTFKDIGQELHDNIGQVLSLVSIHLNTLDNKQNPAKITLMDELLTRALADLRNLSHSLNSDYIRNVGWTELVLKLMTNVQNTGKFTTNIHLDDDLPALGSDKPIILFRMIQEVVNNIIKHAAANTIYLKVKKENTGLVVTIEDNGKGFSNDAVSGGAGLLNLQNRAKIINADLTIKSQPGSGTLVTISVKTNTIG